MGSSGDEFSVLVLASDARPFLTTSDQQEVEVEDKWHDCQEEDFSDLELLQFFQLQPGTDKSGNRILSVIGKYFPAQVISAERLKKYIFQKIMNEVAEGPFCIVYIHTTVRKEDNSPGIRILRWIYEELPSDYKDRLQLVYFLHPGLRSRLAIATLGRFFFSRGLYWKIKYVSRLQYLWEDIKKGNIDIPEFVQNHDDVLEHRPLTDYGIEPDPFHLTEVPSSVYSFGKYETGWSSREEYMS